jgi:predicted Holliday junction resolvase-like endonuclease
VATGNLTQDLVSLGANAMIMNIKNPYVGVFMQHATNSFLVSLFANSASDTERQRQIMAQRQLMEQQLRQRQQELERQRRIAEQQRMDAMFARLQRQLKLEGVAFGLTLKAMNTSTDLELKSMSMNSGGPDGLKLKMSPATPTSYGLKGLPGIYVGGPASSDAADSAANVATNGGAAPSANPNLVSGLGTGTTGPGIPGLPGIYLDGVQPNQAPQLAQAAEKLSGPERDIAQDTALEAAQKNSQITTSQDPQAQTFQKAVQDYDHAATDAKTAQQQLSNQQASVEADHAVLDMARSKLDSATATEAQQQAYSQMVQAAKTDEDAAAAGQRIFDNAQATLSLSRTKAAGALAALAPSSAANDTSVVDLSHATHSQPNLLRASSPRAPVPADAPAPALIAAPALVPALVRTSVNVPATPLTQTAPQLCTQLVQTQDALRRLMHTQEIQSQNREEWEKEIDDDSDDALKRGLDMVRDYAGDKLTDHLQELIKGQDKEIENLYLEISNKKGSEVGDLQKKFEQLDLNKARLKDALRRVEIDKQHLSELADERDFFEWTHKKPDDLKGAMEGVQQLADMLLRDPAVQHALRLTPESSSFIKSVGSLMGSGYDIYADYLGAQQIKQLNQNSEQFLQAVKALNRRIQTTVTQLNVYKNQTPEGYSCTAR